MGRRYGSEENYFGQWNQPVQQPTGTSELPSAAVNANNAALALGRDTADKFSRTSQRLSEEQASDTKEGGKMLAEGIKNIPSEYQTAAKHNADMDRAQQQLEQGQQQIEQGARNATRDVAYGDQNAATNAQQGVASLESTKAGTASTEQQTEASKAKLPGEIAAQGQQAAVTQSTLSTMAMERKRLGLENANSEDTVAQNSVAAQVAQTRSKAANPQEADRLEEEWAQTKGKSYTPTQLAAGRRLGKTTAAQDSIVANSAIASDPKYQVATAFKQKAAAAANTMAELKADLADYENNSNIYSPDSPTAKDAQARIESKLAALGQTNLLNNSQMSSLKRALMPGQSWTTTAALKDAVASTSRMLQAGLVRESDMLSRNPHISADERQQYLQQISFDPNAAGVQRNPLDKFNQPVNTGPGPAGPIPAMNGNNILQKPDLRTGRGAVPLNQPAQGQ